MSEPDGIAPLTEATDRCVYGGKAAQLAASLNTGLPVPPGWALSAHIVELIASGDGAPRERLFAWYDNEAAGSPVAVRSSAVDEDGASASFAGQHATCLNVTGKAALIDAITAVWKSAHSPGALAYRAQLGLCDAPQMAVVVQSLISADLSGVLFTRHPVTGADERVIEACWGLGEAVVSGLVTPDHLRVARDGRVLEEQLGDKDVSVVADGAGGTRTVQNSPDRARARCLDEMHVAALLALAERCESCFPGASDIEWAFAGSELFLLQRRAVTR